MSRLEEKGTVHHNEKVMELDMLLWVKMKDVYPLCTGN